MKFGCGWEGEVQEENWNFKDYVWIKRSLELKGSVLVDFCKQFYKYIYIYIQFIILGNVY